MSSLPQPPNVFANTLERVRLAVLTILPPGTDVSRIQVEPPRDASHGDVATNAAMVLAKGVGKNPLDLANAIAEALKTDATVESVQVARPGFINLTLKPDVWLEELRRAVAAATEYGKNDIGADVPRRSGRV